MKKIKLSSSNISSLGIINKKKILIIKIAALKTIYFFVSKNVKIEIVNKEIIINSINNNLINRINTIKHNFIFGVKKKLILLGLGFKIFNPYLNDQKIKFKLGFSHIVFLSLPLKNISFTFFKFKRVSGKLNIVIQGIDLHSVSSFANKVKLLKSPDSYKGKGFFYKNQKKKLKILKKK